MYILTHLNKKKIKKNYENKNKEKNINYKSYG